ncbi:NEW3 domain-containing protein [Streptomyces sp. NPDC047028]|uniref:NEW3 domain-containing protein n=1 Tax=Streptomyces sp. NPDC047028 TaxID=3155793 RepID=UPI0033F71E94
MFERARTTRRRPPATPRPGAAAPRRTARGRSALALAAALSALTLGGLAAPAAAESPTDAAYPNLAPTPPMGWNNWSYYGCDISEATVLANARALVSSGLAAKGYDTVTTDDCWMSHSRDADGNLVADPQRFPHGMAYIGDQLHAMGLKFGIYEDAGTSTCGGYPGSYGHIQQDADLFARWKVDYLKLDGCNVPVPAGQSADDVYHGIYGDMSRALLATGRPIVFSVSAPAYFEGGSDWHHVISWSAQVGNLWREGRDIAMEPGSARGKWSSIKYNYGYNVQLADLQSPGRWNDPDFLLAGQSRLTGDEIRSQMSLWSVMAAPLISSTDLTKASPDALSVLGNEDVIAVDQDAKGIQGRIVGHGDGYDVLSKPLANGDRAVALFNSSDEARTITTTATEAGLPAGTSYLLKDLWSKKTTQTTGTIAANLPPHATALYRVHAGPAHRTQPATAITWTRAGGDDGTASTWKVSLADHGPTGLTRARLAVDAPDGWAVSPSTASLGRVGPGTAKSVTVTVKGPDAKPGTTVSTLTATADYRAGGAGTGTVAGRASVVTDVPYPSLAAAFDNTGITSESAPPAPGNYTTGDFDGDGDTYSAQALAAAGATPGAEISKGGVTWTFPDSAPGTPDNVAAAGQSITLTGSGSELWFLGAEAGFTSGQVKVTYTDGSTGTGSLGFPNWCCTDGTEYGATTVVTTDHRNTPAGPANYGIGYKLFGNPVPLTPGKTVRTVTLPDADQIHVFAISVR